MAKFFITLLILYYSVKANTEYKYEVIDEFVPKLIFPDKSGKIFKYNWLCGDKRNETNIYFQAMTNDRYSLEIYFYDDFTKIKKDEDGFYRNYTSREEILDDKPVIIFNKLSCNKDYYFVILRRGSLDNIVSIFIQITIFTDETNIFNLSPLLSLDYTLFPRNNKEECFYYSFNESKYALIDYNGLLTIEENGQIISDYDKTNIILFKKNMEYKIYYKASPIEPPTWSYKPTKSPAIHFHFYNEKSFFKYNKEDFPIMLFGYENESYFEINISDYKVGQYILLESFYGKSWNIKYQYKNDFKNNNFISLGEHQYFNYIPIKKAKDDSSLLLYIKHKSSENLLSMINIVKDDIMEIVSDFNSTINGPKFVFLDYYKFNYFKSFAIESNKNFSFFRQEMDSIIQMDNKEYNYNYIYISKHNENKPLINKRIFIYLNSTDSYHLLIKKYNFSISENDYSSNGHKYLELCQGEEPKTELYYYKSQSIIEMFSPVFGNFDLFFINKDEIKTLSDFDFSKINKTMEVISTYKYGYLKIVCKEPTLVKHSYIYDIQSRYEDYILSSGKRYFFSTYYIPKNIKLSDELIGKTISLKFSIFRANNNNQVKLNLNGTEYILSNDNKSMEFELESYQDIRSYLIIFDIEEDKKKEMWIEIVVGTKEDLSQYQIINLNESLGNLKIDNGKGVIIKIPKEYNESYYNYSIIQNKLSYFHRYYIDISYDKIEFMTLKIMNNNDINDIYEYSHFVSLFKVNPYSYIPNKNDKSDEKFFYILLFNYGYSDSYISIKKPKLYTDINLKKMNFFPQLKGDDEKYYYQILVPKEDYDSLLIQTDPNSNFTFSISNDNIIYPLDKLSLLHDGRNILYIALYNISIDKIENKNIYLNYYGNSFSDGYVRYISGDESILDKIGLEFRLNFRVEQKKKTNKLILNLKSYSYYIKRPIIYYLIINEPYDDYSIIFSAITEQRNFDKNKMMLKVEDNGENENFTTELEIDKELIDYEPEHTSNEMIMVPVDKESNLVYINLKTSNSFRYENIKSNYIIIIIIVIAILFLIIIVGLFIYRKKKKEKGNNIEDEIANEKILSDN